VPLCNFLTYKTSSCANFHTGGRFLLHNFLCLSWTDMFPHKCVVYETCSCACSCTKRRTCAHFFDLRRHRFRVTFNIRHHVFHQISNRRSRNDVQPHDSTYEPFSVCNFPHTKPCLRTLVWPTRRIVMRVHCEKACLYAIFLTYKSSSCVNFDIGGRFCIQLVT